MPADICIIDGHSDPAGGRFCNALADAYAEGVAAAGHGVTRIALAKLDFPLLRRAGLGGVQDTVGFGRLARCHPVSTR